MSDTVKDYINVFIILSFAWIIALGGGYKSLSYNGYPILILCMITSFIVHWIIFIPSFLAKTENFMILQERCLFNYALHRFLINILYIR